MVSFGCLGVTNYRRDRFWVGGSQQSGAPFSTIFGGEMGRKGSTLRTSCNMTCKEPRTKIEQHFLGTCTCKEHSVLMIFDVCRQIFGFCGGGFFLPCPNRPPSGRLNRAVSPCTVLHRSKGVSPPGMRPSRTSTMPRSSTLDSHSAPRSAGARFCPLSRGALEGR